MDDVQKFHNIVEALHEHRNESPFSAEAWAQQDNEIVRLQNAIRHIKNCCQSRTQTSQDIIDMCDDALYGTDENTVHFYHPGGKGK